MPTDSHALDERKPAIQPEWFRLRDAATYTGFSIRSICEAAAAGELKFHVRPSGRKRGIGERRFRRGDLDAWVMGKVPPKAD